jgi:hypothetical protein
MRLDDAVGILSSAFRGTALHEWKEEQSQIRQPLDYCWSSVFGDLMTEVRRLYGQLPDCCPIIVPNLIVQLCANFSSRYWVRPCGAQWVYVYEILFQICRMGRCTPDFFSFTPPLPMC